MACADQDISLAASSGLSPATSVSQGECFDAHCAADREHQPMKLLLGRPVAQRGQRLGDPADSPALP